MCVSPVYYSLAAVHSFFYTQLLVNTGSTSIQAADNDERVARQWTWGPKGEGREQAWFFNLAFYEDGFYFSPSLSYS